MEARFRKKEKHYYYVDLIFYMVKYLKYFLLIGILSGEADVFAQDPVFSQFYSSPLNVNPALAGNGSADWRFVANRRSQWIADGLDPLNTTSVSLDGKLFRQKDKETNYIGGGLLFLQDQGMAGAYKSNSFSFILSSHVSLDDNDNNGLSIGLGGTYSNTLIDYSQLSFASQLSSSGFNRSLPTSEPFLSTIKPYFAVFAGVTYTYGDENQSFDIGASGYRFMKTNKSALSDPTQIDPPRYNVHAGYQTYLSPRMVLNTNAIYVKESTANSYTLGLNLGHILEENDLQPTVLNTGLWYRANEAIIPYLGLSYRNFQVGLTYDINTSTGNSVYGSLKTYEFSLIIRSPQSSGHAIPCPWK